ncbi:LysR family transcriptional regulator [Clostridium sp. AM58-1XD]|uniref:LysR family transcriptional regulator n=1 Tax=Clostridium sp. AM58-1XD TaxID=2292307 RepID=UPI0015F48044|nr:LysR family transcriptional regulator [Clostridium sp. AM58-1XD]
MTELDWEIISTLKRTRNITKSAEFLHITQPTLTKRLQKIESELDVVIAVRNTRGLEFTVQGDYLAKKAEQILSIHQEICQTLHSMQSDTAGSLKLFADNSCGRFVLPQLLNSFHQNRPGIKVTASSALRAKVIHSIERGESHVGIVKGYIDHYTGYISRLSQEQGCILYKEAFSISDLPYLPRIDFVMDPYNQSLIDEWWYSHFSIPPLIGMRVSHGEIAREMVMNGLGYSIFLSRAYTAGCKHLFISPLIYGDGRPVIRDTVIFCKSDYLKLPFVKDFIDFSRSLPSSFYSSNP